VPKKDVPFFVSALSELCDPTPPMHRMVTERYDVELGLASKACHRFRRFSAGFAIAAYANGIRN
jgi:hypothetical protein